MKPIIIEGGKHTDNRGKLLYNNNFDATSVKRIYFIENENVSIPRRWQGHKIEERWFIAVIGEFKIQLLKIDNWKVPNKDIKPKEFYLSSNTFDVLHIPSGYVTSIQSLSKESKLMVLSNYLLGEIKDEYKFPMNYFKKI